jgi:hypothetical protein
VPLFVVQPICAADAGSASVGEPQDDLLAAVSATAYLPFEVPDLFGIGSVLHFKPCRQAVGHHPQSRSLATALCRARFASGFADRLRQPPGYALRHYSPCSRSAQPVSLPRLLAKPSNGVSCIATVAADTACGISKLSGVVSHLPQSGERPLRANAPERRCRDRALMAKTVHLTAPGTWTNVAFCVPAMNGVDMVSRAMVITADLPNGHPRGCSFCSRHVMLPFPRRSAKPSNDISAAAPVAADAPFRVRFHSRRALQFGELTLCASASKRARKYRIYAVELKRLSMRQRGRDASHRAGNLETHLTHMCMQRFQGLWRQRSDSAFAGSPNNADFTIVVETADRCRGGGRTQTSVIEVEGVLYGRDHDVSDTILR